MKWILYLSILLLSAAGPTVWAQGPDDQYVQVYRLIQQADQFGASGQSSMARDKFLEAQSALKKLQTSYPNWNVNVIEFRLHYVEEKLGSIPAEKPTPTVLEKTRPTTEKPVPVIPPRSPGDRENRIKALTGEVLRLEAANALLDAKLKEALAARPAAADPRELAKAEEKIKLLEKEKELLRVTLEQEQAKQNKPVESGLVGDLKKKLAETNEQLVRQNEIAQALAREKEILEARLDASKKENEAAKILRLENEALRRQLTESRPVTPTAPKIETPTTALSKTPGTSQSNETMIAGLQLALRVLQEEKAALEKTKKDLEARLADGPLGPAKPGLDETDKVRRLEGERDDLLKKLNETTKQLYDNKARAEQIQREQNGGQLANLRARLEALEARKVPYTPEELALFKPPQLAAAKVDPKAGKKPLRELPKGAAPLLAEAERAFASRRFDEAETKYKQVLGLDEKNVFTLSNLAATQLEQNRMDEAESNLTKALGQEPTDAHSLSLLGILKFRQEKFDEALDALSRAAQLDPQNPETQNYLGITLSQKGQRAAAEAALRRAIQLAPGYGGAHHNLAVVYATQQPPFSELARWHYQKALVSGHPQNPELEKLIEGGRSASNAK